jgi:hypothetical protein
MPFGVSILIFPLRDAERPLFEAIMPVVLTVFCVLLANLYFRKLESNFVREGLILGGLVGYPSDSTIQRATTF